MLDRTRPIVISERVSRVALPPGRILLQRQMRIEIDDERELAEALQALAGCGKSRDFGETVMKRARNGNPGLIKSTGYEGAKGDESGWKHHRPTFSAAC